MTVQNVDYTHRVTVPIRDMHENGRIVFLVDVYGVLREDLTRVPGGSAPLMRAVRRMGLDPARYQATLWDV